MSSKHARLVRKDDGWRLEDLSSTNGSFLAGSRIESAAIVHETTITLGATVLIVNPVELLPAGAPRFVDMLSLHSRPRGTATLVPVVEHALPRLVRVAMAKLPVLLLGESGAGKEVLARTIHDVSARRGSVRGNQLRRAHAYAGGEPALRHLLSVGIVTSTEDLVRLEHVGDSLRPPRERVSA